MPLPRAVLEAEAAADAAMKLAQENTGSLPTLTESNPEEKETPAQSPTSLDDGIDWKHKYDVLKGKFNQSVPALQKKVTELESAALSNPKFAEMERETFAANQRISQLEQALQEKNSKQTELTLNPYLKDEYGEEFAKAVSATANDMVSSKIQELDQRLTGQIQTAQNDVSKTNANTRMDTLKSLLNAGGCDFNVINDDPMFHEWLAGIEDYSGQERQSLLENAYNTGDVKRASRFYFDFMGTQKQRFNSNPLSLHVEPVSSLSNADRSTATLEFDEAAFQELHNKFRSGKITEAEFDKKEREFFSALKS